MCIRDSPNPNPNPDPRWVRLGFKGSFKPKFDETSRVVACGTLTLTLAVAVALAVALALALALALTLTL